MMLFNDLRVRTISGAFLVALMTGAYLHSVTMFTALMLAMLLVILFFEWPPLIQAPIITFTLITIVYPVLPFLSLIYLNYAYHYACIWLPIYPLIIAWTADTAGYFVGKSIGKHKICPSISPGKSWEGLIGSFVGIMLMNLFVLPKMDIEPFSNYHYLWYFLGALKGWVAFSLFCLVETIIAFLGGLLLSKLKRMSKIKDAGSLLPGHGGFLDRFDSVLTTVIFVWILTWSNRFFH